MNKNLHGGFSAWADPIPVLSSGPRSPTLGHEGTFDHLAEPFHTSHPTLGNDERPETGINPPGNMPKAAREYMESTRKNPTMPPSAAEWKEHEKKYLDFHKENEGKPLSEQNRAFGKLMSEDMAQDSPTGKKFTEHLHERDLEGHFVESSNRKKIRRREE